MKKSPELSNDLRVQLGEAETFGSVAKRLWRENKLAAASAVVILLFVLAAILAPVLTPYTFDGMDLLNRLSPPSIRSSQMVGPTLISATRSVARHRHGHHCASIAMPATPSSTSRKARS